MSRENRKLAKIGEIRTQISGVRTRIAPSPTGFLHLGTARAALFNYLFAKKQGGKFILRIEDTDLERSDPKFEKEIIKGLVWLGIEWDEGPAEISNFQSFDKLRTSFPISNQIPNSKSQIPNSEKNTNYKLQINPTQPPLNIKGGGVGLQKYIGEFGPYRQSERIETYTKYIKKLLDENKAYYCFCTEEELEKERKVQMTKGQAPKYSGKCRNLSKDEVRRLKAEGKKSIIRFRVPENRKIKFHDLIRGDLEFDSNLIGDITIAKDEKTPLYNFAVVIDDYLMKISHVIRGEDHLSNTPKQLLLQEALGLPHPQYGHLPLILGPDRSKLSKRHGATSLREYQKAGYLPEAMLNFMAFLGWNPKSKKEIFSLKELISEFDLKGVGKSGAVFNLEKLDWINGLYIRQMSLDKLTERCLPYLVGAKYLEKFPISNFQFPIKSQSTNYKSQKYKIIQTSQVISFKDLKKVIALEQVRIKKLLEITKVLDFYFKKDIKYEANLLIWKKTDKKIIKKNLEILQKFFEKLPPQEFERKNLEKKVKELIKKENLGVGETLWPFRAALSGKKGSPGPYDLTEVLGKDLVLKRIMQAITLL